METSFVPCGDCEEGYVAKEIDHRKIMIPCRCRVAYNFEKMIEIELRKSNIGFHYKEKHLSDYRGEQSKEIPTLLQKFIDKFNDIGHKKCLYFYGGTGTQKTTIANVIGKELLTKRFSVYYMESMIELIRLLSMFENYKTDDVKQKIDTMADSDLLIIDECWSNKNEHSVSDYQLNYLRTFLKQRIEVQQKSTIFISNFPIEQIAKKGYTESIQDLIHRNTVQKVIEFKDNFERVNTNFEIEELWS